MLVWHQPHHRYNENKKPRDSRIQANIVNEFHSNLTADAKIMDDLNIHLMRFIIGILKSHSMRIIINFLEKQK